MLKNIFNKRIQKYFNKDILNIIWKYYNYHSVLPLFNPRYNMYVTNKRLDTISISSCGTKYSGFLSVDGECDSICSCTHFSQYSSPKSYKQYVLPKHITIMLETIDDTHM